MTNCTVYEVWGSSPSGLLYVGIADDFRRRWAQHCAQSWWVGEVVIDHIDLHVFETREHARMVEAAVINEQSPRYNTAREEGAYARYRALDADAPGPDADDAEWTREDVAALLEWAETAERGPVVVSRDRLTFAGRA